MKLDIKRLFPIILSLFLFGVCANAQIISNVRSTFSCPGKMTINYDLYIEGNASTTNVTVSYSTDNGQAYYPCTTVTGDLNNQSTGKDKSVIWDLAADGFSTGFFVFKVEVPKIECVIIRGVCWATCNVDVPGTFTDKPEDPGMFYQWNRKIAWPATGAAVTGWDSSHPTGTTWETDNNVCPTGYRVPTLAELRSLMASGSQWITRNGVNGRLFGSGNNTIFLPAVGYRSNNNGALSNAESGYYWSSTPNESLSAYYLSITSAYDYTLRNFGFSVRCVAE